MNLKISLIVILSIFFFVTPKICLAKVITIDGVDYETDSILEHDSFIYNANKNTLTLQNANLKSIKTNENLIINLIGENTLLSEDTYIDSIVAKELKIIGNSDSSLQIVTTKRGIVASRLQIDKAIINIKSLDNSILSSSSYNYDAIINNSSLTIETNQNAFNIVSANLYLNNSEVIVNNALALFGDFGQNIYINNSKLHALNITTLRYNQYLVYVNGNSNVFINATNNYFYNKNYILDENLEILASVDNLNYQEIVNNKDQYIKIFSSLDENVLLEKAESLNLKELELKKQEETLILEETRIANQLEEINTKEATLKSKEENLNNLEQELSNISLELENKNNDLLTLDSKLQEEKLNLEVLTNNLKEKEEELKNKEEDLLIIENNICKEEIDNNVFNNMEDFKETFDYIKNPKTFNNLFEMLSLFIFAFLGLIIIFLGYRKGKFDG